MAKKKSKTAWLEKQYFSMPAKKRRIIGWIVIVMLLTAIGMGGYYSYCGVRSVYYTVAGWWKGEKSDVTDHSGLPEYSGNHRHRTFTVRNPKPKRNIVSYGRAFNDLNDVQLDAAKRLGIHPLKNRDELEGVADKLVKLRDTRYYTIDKLTQSVPYLVPDAADFLTELGRRMQEYNGTHSRFVITSVLRTGADVSSLQKSNGNASSNSCHQYATTFDITYNRFDIHDKTSEGQLKLDLARALADLRDAGYCYVKYERKQPCFHVTVRK